ncbi:TetR family transcriptional regulator [Phycicoccus sp. BSK3Z-2]|uniref:TetR family transcriptional regulator n=1 Tax=Phycicoccus avicenniae TaxID=2828860 RepID=A0A941D8E5_9MICO|nr:TetR/AcrR family transcriptional regulator [Phycicoccus avicenniae]MBR7743665.1 TetR family transcriptional regulator [Phycicoccus avicenniae]
MTTAGTDGPTDRESKKRRTRLRLHTAAVRLAVERGYQATTADEIAAAAGVSPRTFFNYFATKEDAIVGSDPDRPARLHRAVVERPSHERPAEALRAVLTDQVREMEGDPDLWRMRSTLAASTPELSTRLAGAGDRLETALVEAVYLRAGTDPADDLATGLSARLAMAAVRAAFHQHRAAGADGSLADRLDTAFDAAGVR